MSKQKEMNRNATELVAIQPAAEITVLPPNSGVIGRFLDETHNMFKGRAMRMSGLLRRINETGHRMEAMMRTAAEMMDASEAQLEQDFRKEGLLRDTENHSEVEQEAE